MNRALFASFFAASLSTFGCSTFASSGSTPGISIETHYDAFADVAYYKTVPRVDLTSGPTFNLDLWTMYQCVGSRTCRPESVFMYFYCESDAGYRFTDNHELTFKVDGNERRIDDVQYEPARGLARRTAENMYVSIPIELFGEIARAEECSGRIGNVSFLLTREHKRHFRMLIDSMRE